MDDEVSVEHEGTTYMAGFSVYRDTLTVYLPDGSTRTTELRGVEPASAAKIHLRGYISKNI